MSIRTNADLRAAAASGKLDEMKRLDLSSTQITDLSPLAGMPLQLLYLGRTQITDLSPLAGMPLELLDLGRTQITDLSPLAGMPLKLLYLGRTQIADLSPLAGMPLEVLDLNSTQIAVVHIDPRDYELRAPQVGDETRHDTAARLKAGGMQCNCDLDNFEPEPDTGHSHVCRIHKAALAEWRNK